jgi:hypothetical protein
MQKVIRDHHAVEADLLTDLDHLEELIGLHEGDGLPEIHKNSPILTAESVSNHVCCHPATTRRPQLR